MPKTHCVLRKDNPVRHAKSHTEHNAIQGEQKMMTKDILFKINQDIDNILCFIRLKIISMLS